MIFRKPWGVLPWRSGRWALLLILAQAAPVAAATRVAPPSPNVEPVQVAGRVVRAGLSALGSPANRTSSPTPPSWSRLRRAGDRRAGLAGAGRRAAGPDPPNVTPLPMRTWSSRITTPTTSTACRSSRRRRPHRRPCGAREYLNSDTARLRLQASREELAPWVDAHAASSRRPLGRRRDTTLVLSWAAPSFACVRVPGRRTRPRTWSCIRAAAGVLFAGDLVFRGRVPFVGQADSRRWIDRADRLMAYQAARDGARARPGVAASPRPTWS
jgi:hypothetical protein